MHRADEESTGLRWFARLCTVATLSVCALACSAQYTLAREAGESEPQRATSITISAPPTVVATGSRPNLLWLGDQYALVWQSGQQPSFVTFDRTGAPLSTAISAAPAGHQLSHAIWSGSQVAVATGVMRVSSEPFSDHAIELRQLDATGAPQRSPIVVVTGAQMPYPRVAWSGASFGVTWAPGVMSGLAVLSPSGEVLGTAADITGPGDCWCPVDIVWSGTAFFVAYANDSFSDAGYGTGPGYAALGHRYDASANALGARFGVGAPPVSSNPVVAVLDEQLGLVFRSGDTSQPTLALVSNVGVHQSSRPLEPAGPVTVGYHGTTIEALPPRASLPSGGFAVGYSFGSANGMVAPLTVRVVILDHEGQQVAVLDLFEAMDSRSTMDLEWNGEELGVVFAPEPNTSPMVHFSSVAIP